MDTCNLDYIQQQCNSHKTNRHRLFKRLLRQYPNHVVDQSTKRKCNLLLPKQIAQDFLRYYDQFTPKLQLHGEVYAFFASSTSLAGAPFVYLKVGRTKCWERRKKIYVGPSRIQDQILVFRCRNMKKCEDELKLCLRAFQAVSNEWFLIPVARMNFVRHLLRRVVNRTIMKSLYIAITS